MFKTSFGAVIVFFSEARSMQEQQNRRTERSCRLLPSCRRSIKRLHSVKPWLMRLVAQPFQRGLQISNVQTKSRCHTPLLRCPERTSQLRVPLSLLGARSSYLVVHEVVVRRSSKSDRVSGIH